MAHLKGGALQSLAEALVPNLAAPGSQPQAIDFMASIYIALATFALRIVAEQLLMGPLRRRLKSARPGLETSAGKVFDDVWIAVFSGATTAFAWWVLLHYNGGCTPLHTAPCLQGWPNHPASKELRWAFQLMFGYYAYEMLCTAVGRGTKLAPDMVVHHAVTMLMQVIAYQVTLMRYGLMAQALMDMSNPILHAAKTLNTLAVPRLETLKWAVFGMFVLTFFLARLVALPFVCLYPGVVDGFAVLPRSWAWTCNGLMWFIYVLQVYWFYKIMLIALGKNGTKEKGDKSA